jgi:hypothetical protein
VSQSYQRARYEQQTCNVNAHAEPSAILMPMCLYTHVTLSNCMDALDAVYCDNGLRIDSLRWPRLSLFLGFRSGASF